MATKSVAYSTTRGAMAHADRKLQVLKKVLTTRTQDVAPQKPRSEKPVRGNGNGNGNKR